MNQTTYYGDPDNDHPAGAEKKKKRRRKYRVSINSLPVASWFSKLA
jgi:hypothetical protein